MMLNVVLVVCTIAGQNGISSGLTTIHAIVGSQVTLNCNMAIDSTVSDIFWERYKANEKMTFFSNISGISGTTLENPSLIIEVASILDSGLYTCNTKTYNNITHSNATVLIIEGASPDVKLESMSVSSIFGIPLTLQVDIISTPFVKHVYWTKENNFGELIIINARATGFEGGNISVPSLTISSPDFIDGGYYTCYARNDIGLGKSHKISMKVEGAVPLVSLDTLNYEASYGSRVSVKCTVTAFPNYTRIYWQRRKNDIITTITEETIGVTGSTLESPTLTIEFVTISDSGTYTCLAENLVGLGSSRSTLLLVAGGRPVVNIGSALYSTVYGTKVTLYCVVNSDPPCTLVHWKKKSKGGLWSIITSGAVGILGVNVTQPSLTFIFPVDSDAGEYICYATNALGTSSSLSTLLTVIGENPLVSISSISNSAKHGAECTLYCSVDANPVHKEVYWEFTKNDLVRKITSKTPGIRGVNEDNPSLTISFVTISDDGFYTCCAINIVGIGRSKSVRLSVEAAIPFVTAVLQHYSVKEGSGVSMICKVKSEPYQTNVYWQKEKDGQVSKLKHGTTGILGVSLDDPSLTFTAVEKTDSGLYICCATNAIGTGSSRAIILEVEPFTESTATDKTVIIDQQSGDTATWVGSIVGAIAAIATVVATIIAYCQCNNRKQPDEDVTPEMTHNDYQNRLNSGPMKETQFNTSEYAVEKPKGIDVQNGPMGTLHDTYAVEEKKAVPGRDLSIKNPNYNETDDSERILTTFI